MDLLSRRIFLRGALGAAAGGLVPWLQGCTSNRARVGEALPLPADGYPRVEVGGRTYRELGRNFGEAVRDRVLDYLSVAPDYPTCRAFRSEGGEEVLARMLGRARNAFPDHVEELEGMSEALGVPFMDLFAYNCRSEIAVFNRTAGCSTLGRVGGGAVILAHNEDGDDRNVGRMVVARVDPPSGVRFLSFVYPGLLPGNGPGVNCRGVVQTTNYIEPHRAEEGIPRYFVGRAALEAKSLADAVKRCTVKGRAFPWHHNLASLPEGRLLSVETVPGKWDVQEISSFHLHTNHLVHPGMIPPAGPLLDVPYPSSLTRMEVLREAVRRFGEPTTEADMIRLLSSHVGRPYSPCRHPQGTNHGITLGTAVFSSPEPGMVLYHGNPCRGIRREYAF